MSVWFGASYLPLWVGPASWGRMTSHIWKPTVLGGGAPSPPLCLKALGSVRRLKVQEVQSTSRSHQRGILLLKVHTILLLGLSLGSPGDCSPRTLPLCTLRTLGGCDSLLCWSIISGQKAEEPVISSVPGTWLGRGEGSQQGPGESRARGDEGCAQWCQQPHSQTGPELLGGGGCLLGSAPQFGLRKSTWWNLLEAGSWGRRDYPSSVFLVMVGRMGTPWGFRRLLQTGSRAVSLPASLYLALTPLGLHLSASFLFLVAFN